MRESLDLPPVPLETGSEPHGAPSPGPLISGGIGGKLKRHVILPPIPLETGSEPHGAPSPGPLISGGIGGKLKRLSHFPPVPLESGSGATGLQLISGGIGGKMRESLFFFHVTFFFFSWPTLNTPNEIITHIGGGSGSGIPGIPS